MNTINCAVNLTRTDEEWTAVAHSGSSSFEVTDENPYEAAWNALAPLLEKTLPKEESNG